jgi:crotonobetainyl-CoA:carnitine CoA-transferase CaiB-like acyl-CoA transferase
MSGPLAGITVLDLTRVLAGPFATQILSDLGAEVIKIERPETGDDTRGWGPPYVKDANGNDTAETAYFAGCNRGKKSVTLDLADPQAQKRLRQLAGECDVLVENYKVGDLARLCVPEIIISGAGVLLDNRIRPNRSVCGTGRL